MKINDKRKVGVLLHITSLPSPFGIGDLGDEAYKMVDSLKRNGISLWQVLPTGPTGYGESPYAPRSTFAGNELFISPTLLYKDGYLSEEDISIDFTNSDRVDYNKVREVKMPLLFKAANNFLSKTKGKKREEFENFRKEEGWWIEDYALFQSLTCKYNDSRWFLKWDDNLKKRKEETLSKAREENKSLIDIYCVLQFFFFKEWSKFKSYANKSGVRLIGDLPFYVASDSADAWVNTSLLSFDKYGNQKESAGVPPDYFSLTGQLWGNPVYNWKEMEKDGYSWWIKRIKSTLRLVDIIRIDHFRAFESYWSVPSSEKTAENGKWIKGPGQKFFDKLKEVLGENLPLIAEDLGVITDKVEKLRDDNALPGMKILQFAFGFNNDGTFDSKNAYLPHNTIPNSVLYTGTHDNDTTLGWYKKLDERTKDIIRRYFECSDSEVVWKMIRSSLMSSSDMVIIPMQDILSLDSDCRMNTPSTCGTFNWSWKMKEEDITSQSLSGIKYFSSLFGRA